MKVPQTGVNIEDFFVLEINILVSRIRVIALDVLPLRAYTEATGN